MTEKTPAHSVSILGSTGSVGTQTIDLLQAAPDRYRVVALVGGSNVDLLAKQARALRAQRAVIGDPAGYAALRDALSGTGIEAACGEAAIIEAAAMPADWTMAAITGAAGLAPTLTAIRRGRIVALANKEALVCAGPVMLRAIRDAGATLLPVDSEHNAIFQALDEKNRGTVERIVLTASGGPFLRSSRADMEAATPEAALRHPTWTMGAKITIDSATMMNKGLEVIEAARIFDMPEEQIGVLIHPQSVIHGLVCYHDGSRWARPTCAFPSRTPWLGRRGLPHRRRVSIWRQWRGSSSSSPTSITFPPCGWRATPCVPAAAPPPFSMPRTRSPSPPSCSGASVFSISPARSPACSTAWARCRPGRWMR
jgi:1-deoxy-D-xylulose 5-phosphate reductoisomerase